MKVKLTEAAVERLRLKPGQTDEFFFDEKITGFCVRIRIGGSRKYIFQYRFAGKQRPLILGDVGSLPFADAKKRAQRARVAVDDGKDPAFEKESNKAAALRSFEVVVPEYLEKRDRDVASSDMKQRSLDEVTRHLKKHFKDLNRMPVAGIGRGDVAGILRKIAKDRGPVAADRARSNLSTFFAWAIGEGICETNPVDGTNTNSKYVERQRALIELAPEKAPNYDDIVEVWKGAADDDYGAIVRLLILTACRRDEIGSLSWSEIDREARLILLPGARTKNGSEHVVPLCDAALAILDTLERKGDRDLVFGSGKGGYSGWSKSKREMDERVKLAEPWTLHDLRRTARTGMGLLGVEPHVAEAVLNHLPAKLVRTYDVNRYLPQKRQALDLWADHLMRRVNGETSNVVLLRASSTV
jgi:integrase